MQSSTARKLRQIPQGALMVGVDPHKHKHAVVVKTQQAEVVAKFKVSVSWQGYTSLLRRVQPLAEERGNCAVIYAIEAGGHYWCSLAAFLLQHGQSFRLINPLTLKRHRDGEDLNRNKSDYRDAEMAAELLRTGKFTETELPSGVYANLRAAHRAYRRNQKQLSRLVNLVQSLLDVYFPEFQQAFRDVRGETALSVLQTGIAPSALAALKPEAWIKLVREHYPGRRLAVRKVLALQHLAQETVGVAAGALPVSEELQDLVVQVRVLQEQAEQWARRVEDLVRQTPEYGVLKTIRGLGVLTIAGLVAEIGPLGRFNCAQQLIKLAGTNPTLAESAGRQRSHTPISKMGRAGLRCCLWVAAMGLLRANPDFRAWAKRLRERPSHPLKYQEVLGAVANRLLRVAFALIKTGQAYTDTREEVVAA